MRVNTLTLTLALTSSVSTVSPSPEKRALVGASCVLTKALAAPELVFTMRPALGSSSGRKASDTRLTP